MITWGDVGVNENWQQLDRSLLAPSRRPIFLWSIKANEKLSTGLARPAACLGVLVALASSRRSLPNKVRIHDQHLQFPRYLACPPAARQAFRRHTIPLPLTRSTIFHAPGDATGFNQYGSFSNPTWDAVEEILAHLEEAPCLAFPSGMAGISPVFFALLKSSDRILLPSDGYHTMRALADRFLGAFAIAATSSRHPHSSTAASTAVASSLSKARPTRRSTSTTSKRSPRLYTRRVACWSPKTRPDNTTMTLLGQCPLDLRADIVVAADTADTKAPNSHSDVLFGHVASRNVDVITIVAECCKTAGGISGTFEAWLVHRGLETLKLRSDHICSSAEITAPRLKATLQSARSAFSAWKMVFLTPWRASRWSASTFSSASLLSWREWPKTS